MEWLFQTALMIGGVVIGYCLSQRRERNKEREKTKRIAPLLADALEGYITEQSRLADQLENNGSTMPAFWHFNPETDYIDNISEDIPLFGGGAPFVLSFHQEIKRIKSDIAALNEAIRLGQLPVDSKGLPNAEAVVAHMDNRIRGIKCYVTELRRWADN